MQDILQELHHFNEREMKTKQDDVLSRIREAYPHLSKGQKLLANYITDHYDKAVYLTAARLGADVGVSESTVVRFATELGYDGYPGLQHALDELIRTRLTALQKIEVSRSRIDQNHLSISVMQSDIANIKETMSMTDEESIKQACSLLLKARTVYVLGVRSSAPVAYYLAYYLNFVLRDARLISTNSISETFEQMIKIGPDDAMVGISFPRYSKRTVKAMEFARSRGASVIAVTDNEQAPVAASAQCVLKAYTSMSSLVDSLVGPMSLMNALLVSLSMDRQMEIEQTFSLLEKIWKEYDVYENDNDEDDTYGTILS